VFIRASHHVPPPPEAVNDAISALLETLEREPEVIVRAVMGHWLFGFIHPYMDGNGRMARFPMNFMMASGGCPWIMRRGVSEQVGGPKGAGGRIAVLLMSPDGKENRASGLGFRSMTGSSRTPMDWRISLILERTLCAPSWKRCHNQFKCSAAASLPGHPCSPAIGCNPMVGHHNVRRALDEPIA